MTERLEVEHLVDAGRVLDVHEELHAEHGVDEHDEKQQETDPNIVTLNGVQVVVCSLVNLKLHFQDSDSWQI